MSVFNFDDYFNSNNIQSYFPYGDTTTNLQIKTEKMGSEDLKSNEICHEIFNDEAIQTLSFVPSLNSFPSSTSTSTTTSSITSIFSFSPATPIEESYRSKNLEESNDVALHGLLYGDHLIKNGTNNENYLDSFALETLSEKPNEVNSISVVDEFLSSPTPRLSSTPLDPPLDLFNDLPLPTSSIPSLDTSAIEREKKCLNSRLSLSNLSKILNLELNETTRLEKYVLGKFVNELKFPLGFQTWVRDTKESERSFLLAKLYDLCIEKYPTIINMDTLEIIIKRATYSYMQGRLRKERRAQVRKERKYKKGSSTTSILSF
ncbi:hypothetical protein WICMUC_003874 [Wickerhamomyces mucosus]|uniref:Uncharacterized protein n=1 Tax=Wickerhamomyces mucosus TaxID=1378264 RepID=A0A9P8PJ32_9ASCO|nr:hypothetical protein WICMUC_003874 [Wickerhamomyces mucosus]